ncbi:CPBP family intramembrane metalloprotease [Mixta theicola]|uniref:CPBP family intramembrane metalloprotease n=1 Tax=Mixta theicola TaxID=1458355 RepID=A0A2K1QCD5_9GAMM|nr:CPBP family intramembrane glutamic endopeptidase [Mixta theicola]PNS12656.1 CPBP family intramembrane metalloprotease [Mixta theicola]GLR10222.1 CAAX amino protease [Mixta theicola]
MKSQRNRVFLTLFYLGSFALYYLITLAITWFPNYGALRQKGLLVPVLCLFEFAVLWPLYRYYQTRRSDIPLGRLQPKSTLLFMLLLLGLMVAQTQFLQPERWLEDQAQQTLFSLWVLLFSAVLLSPVFEEILFRGFLLQSFLLWAPRSRFACILLTSLLFAAMHTQYIHWQTLAVLTLFSMLLCYARLRANGLLLPVLLHMLNNLIALLPSIWFVLQS